MFLHQTQEGGSLDLESSARKKAIRNAIHSVFDISKFRSPHAVTLTMKQARYIGGLCYIKLTETEASQNLRHFLNVVNRKVFGSGGVRKGERLNCYPVLECDSVRFHYHLCLDKPDALTIEGFTALIHKTWRRTNFGYKEVEVKPCDAGWIPYMTKFQTKSDGYADAIDWINYHISEREVYKLLLNPIAKYLRSLSA